MVLKVDKLTTKAELKKWLKARAEKRKKNAKSELSKFFGVWPQIGDGLEIQKKMRNEWD
jgi:hypothetical protein